MDVHPSFRWYSLLITYLTPKYTYFEVWLSWLSFPQPGVREAHEGVFLGPRN